MTAVARLALDHLVVAARTLDEGVDWCDAVFGLRPESGGRHELMGTHNRVFALGGATFPRAYVEIIAIDPQATPPRRARWFDLDDAALQRTLAGGAAPGALGRPLHRHRRDPRPATRCAPVVSTAARSRPSSGPRRTGRCWHITLRTDGRRPLHGAGPALIEWHGRHPTDPLTPSAVELKSIAVGGWPDALAPLLPGAVDHAIDPAAAPVRALLVGRHGPVVLTSPAAQIRGSPAHV